MTKLRTIVIALILAIAVILVFGRGGGFPFLAHWDDESNIAKNAAVANPSWERLAELWQRPNLGLYVPVTYTAWIGAGYLSRHIAADSLTAAPKPWVFHWLNIILHWLNCVILYVLLRKLSSESKGIPSEVAALMGALLFALHPLHVEPVLWASATKDVLGASFYGLTLLGFCKWLRASDRPGAWRWYWAAFTAATLAMLAKPASVTLPVALTGVTVAMAGLSRRRSIGLLPLWLLALAVVVLTKYLQPAEIAVSLPIWQRIVVASDALVFYLAKVLLPSSLVVDYARTPESVLSQPLTYVELAGLAVFIWSCWHWRRRGGAYIAGALVAFAVLLSPNLGLVGFTFQRISTVADRYAYLALAVPAWLVSSWLVRRSALSYCLVGVLLACLAVKSYMQVAIWRDGATLFGHSLALQPNSAIGHFVAGSFALDNHQTAPAISHFKDALRLSPNLERAQNGLGMVYIESGDYDLAVAQLQAVQPGTPWYFLAKTNLCVIHLRQGLMPLALQECQDAARGDPSCSECLLNLGAAYGQMGQYGDAITSFRSALSQEPSRRDAYINLLIAFAATGAADDAIREHQHVITLTPVGQDIPLAAIDSVMALNLDSLAERLLLESMAARDAQSSIYSRLGMLMTKQGKKDEASKHLRTALRLDPANQEAIRAMGHID